MMPTRPRFHVPNGLNTLLHGLFRAVIANQPENLVEFAALYFAELLQYRTENPALDLNDLVTQFPQQQKQENPPLDLNDGAAQCPEQENPAPDLNDGVTQFPEQGDCEPVNSNEANVNAPTSENHVQDISGLGPASEDTLRASHYATTFSLDFRRETALSRFPSIIDTPEDRD